MNDAAHIMQISPMFQRFMEKITNNIFVQHEECFHVVVDPYQKDVAFARYSQKTAEVERKDQRSKFFGNLIYVPILCV